MTDQYADPEQPPTVVVELPNSESSVLESRTKVVGGIHKGRDVGTSFVIRSR